MRKSIPVLAGLFLIFVAILLQVTTIPSVSQIITRLENLGYDLQLRARTLTLQPKPDFTVVIVDIDDKSIASIGRWPWPRSQLGRLVNQIKADGATVVAFDIIFPENQSNPVMLVQNALKQQKLFTPPIRSALETVAPLFESDTILAQSFKNTDAVLGISFLPDNTKTGVLPAASAIDIPHKLLSDDLVSVHGYLANIGVLQNTTPYGGFINVFPDEDGISRRIPLLIQYHEKLYPSLALEAVRRHLLATLHLQLGYYYDRYELDHIKVGGRLIPVDKKAQALIPFVGRSFYFPYYSALDVLEKKIPPGTFAGKIIFLGTSATSLSDLRATSVQNIYPGVEIQATLASGILNNSFFSKPNWAAGAQISVTILLGLLCTFLFPMAGPRLLSILIVAIPCLLFIANSWILEMSKLIFSFLIPATLTITLGIINILYGYFFESRHREKLHAMFGQYVPEKHITEMLSHPKTYTLYGEDRNMTVLFADIRNFTQISEGLTASRLKDLLNAFFTPMTRIIFKHNGTIDKYIGDQIMAFWGAPIKDENHARNALRAALDMQIMADNLEAEFAANNWPKISIGIGLNTGIMSVGDMGSHYRRNYTVLGDAVNMGSRIEGLTKFYRASIIAAKSTCTGQDEFIFRYLDRVRVKGKQMGVDIFQPLAMRADSDDIIFSELKIWQAAIDLYLKQDWEKSNKLITELNAAHPNTRIYQIYLKRIQTYLKSPPPADWDGIFTHTHK